MNGLLKNWDFVRILRLVSGAGFGIYGLYTQDYFLVTAGVLLTVMAALNWSCCSAAGCGTTTNKKAAYKDFVKPYEMNKNKK